MIHILQGVLPFPDNTKMTPEAVEQAMKVLEIHEKLDHKAKEHSEKDGENLHENEVAVLKEMCNVRIKIDPFCIYTYFGQIYDQHYA